MLVGIVSDIHGHLCQEAHDALAPCDIILCAGDVERDSVYMDLELIAPVIAVRGNCDRTAFGTPTPPSASPRIAGVRFFMVHRPEDLGQPADDVRVCVHGHTHIPRFEEREGVLFVNPGSPTAPRGGSKASVLRLTVDAGEVRGHEFVSWS